MRACCRLCGGLSQVALGVATSRFAWGRDQHGFAGVLPSSNELANRTFDYLEAVLPSGPPAELRGNLEQLANEVEANHGGIETLQRAILDNEDLGTASPTFAHRVLALLVTEGMISLFVTNWDDCIERGGPEGTRLNAIVTTTDDMSVEGVRVMKIHGCVPRNDDACLNEAAR